MSERLACKFEDGAIWWRGSDPHYRFKPRDEAERLAEQFERTLKTDWFYPSAAAFAKQIRVAINQHDAYHHEEQAA